VPKQINKPMVVVNIKSGHPMSKIHLNTWHELWVVLLGQWEAGEPLKEKKHGSA